MSTDLAGRLKDQARTLGFDLVGICAPEPSDEGRGAYRAWAEAGLAGEMAYMTRPDRMAKASAPTATLPAMRSMVVVAKSYFTGDLPAEIRDDPSRGLVASYAWGPDYHAQLLPRLRQLRDWLAGEVGGTVAGRVWVDHGPVLERDAAARAGLGFFGKNTMLIHPRWGAWLFLGALLTEAELDLDTPHVGPTCGRCQRCLVACPTDAFPRPYVLDARRCISYLTIELRGPIPMGLRPGLGNRIFGCDICNEVCPYNRQHARRAGDPMPDLELAAPHLVALAGVDAAAFKARYGSTPVARPGRAGFLRNVAVALGNWGSAEAVPALTRLLGDEAPLVRGHAAWALGRIDRPAARRALARAAGRETDGWVREELDAARAGP
jgi:epoxyqueuosine reductase